MEKSLACGDVVPGCKAVMNGRDETEVMERVTAHAKRAHQMEVLPSEVAAKVRAAIKDRPQSAAKPSGKGEPRKELREKVEARQKRLEEALKTSEADGTQTERIAALSTQLAVAADALGGGWPHMTDVTALRLTGWLEASRALVA